MIVRRVKRVYPKATINLICSCASISCGNGPMEFRRILCLSDMLTPTNIRNNWKIHCAYFKVENNLLTYLPNMIKGIKSKRLTPKFIMIEANISLNTKSFLALCSATVPSFSSHSSIGIGIKLQYIAWTTWSIQEMVLNTVGFEKNLVTNWITNWKAKIPNKMAKYCSIVKYV